MPMYTPAYVISTSFPPSERDLNQISTSVFALVLNVTRRKSREKGWANSNNIKRSDICCEFANFTSSPTTGTRALSSIFYFPHRPANIKGIRNVNFLTIRPKYNFNFLPLLLYDSLFADYRRATLSKQGQRQFLTF